ncbi:MAG: hypothetical protein JWP82_1569 [Humibacillus sp.]|nr:hypothetical protein [Humibacillus sp.]
MAAPITTLSAGDDGAVWMTTPRLVLRRPTLADLDDYVRLHNDPRTYAHAPGSMPDAERCRERLADDVADWARDELGYAAVLDRTSGAVLGWAGLRHKDSDRSSLNLYYRLAHDRLGAGLGRELSRALVGWAVEHRPDARVTAMVDLVNTASRRTAESSGLVEVGRKRMQDEPDREPMASYEAPSVQVVTGDDLDAGDAGAAGDTGDAGETGLRAAAVDLWVRVNDAGGSVGFLPGASRAAVGAALEKHLGDVRDGRARLCVLREPGGRLLGLGFWDHALGFPYEHVAVLKRLMVDPAAQGRNLGRLLLGGMVGIARRDLPWVELLRLDYRDGLGLGEFYARAGWTEVGRVPRGLRLTASDYRDDVAMARRVDGSPLS